MQELAARIRTYEPGYWMQSEATEAVDLTRKTLATQQLYGLDKPETQILGRQCLLARRLVERGVRFVQIFSGSSVLVFHTEFARMPFTDRYWRSKKIREEGHEHGSTG